jgi:transcriptional regulator with AAA-type ATPase domain
LRFDCTGEKRVDDWMNNQTEHIDALILNATYNDNERWERIETTKKYSQMQTMPQKCARKLGVSRQVSIRWIK